jgi:hypothetical protein
VAARLGIADFLLQSPKAASGPARKVLTTRIQAWERFERPLIAIEAAVAAQK